MADTPVYVTSIRAVAPLVVTGGTSPVISLSSGGTPILTVPYGGTGVGTITGLIQGNGTSAFTAITNSSTVGQVLRVTGAATYAWGALDLADSDAITGDLPFANLTQGSALSVLGVTGNATADVASIAAGTDNQVLRRSGTALAFGAVNLAAAAAVTGVLPAANVGPAGSDTQVQFNDGGALGASAGFTFTKASGSVDIGVSNTGVSGFTITNANTGTLAYAMFSVKNSASQATLRLFSTTATLADTADFVTNATGGLNFKTLSAVPVRFGVNGSNVVNPNDLVIDASHNVVLSTSIRFTETGGGTDYVGFKAPAAITSSATYTLPAADGTKGYGFTTDGSATVSWQDVGGINVKVYGATGDGSTDDATAIQNAVTAGNAYFPPGTYIISTPIEIPSNRVIFGAGKGSIIKPKANANFTPKSVTWNGTGYSLYACFVNSNVNTDSLDQNSGIRIHDLAFDQSNFTAGYGSAIQMRGITRVMVDHCFNTVGAGFTAFVMCSHYQITNNYSELTTNAAIDQWHEPNNIVIANNVIKASQQGGSDAGVGILVTGATTAHATGHAINAVVVGNVIIAKGGGADKGVGIWLQGGSSASDIKRCTVTGNTILCDGTDYFHVGIDVTGGLYNSVTANTIYAADTGIYLNVETAGWINSDYNMISGNTITGTVSANDISDAGTGNKDTTNSGANTLNIIV